MLAGVAVGKYVPTDRYSHLATLAGVCDFKSEVAQAARPDGVVTKVGVATVDGVQTTELKEGDTLTWVAAPGEPRIVKIQNPQVTAHFSDYAKPVSFRAPAPEEIA
ncbi:hypothetical protein HH310_04920 [Actinoplanes sp. TBRC 11911]|uniref:hypothetical protein n=1 Tax=Actinoplanes sp. TBRC 11911 TaxID=2729386 RepID=UPI00145DE87E|nr:hypothetical protein [Actinoplanes sp. TBRC 11911]NMO50535.1 hypothetical protein [Actinoplanes sp. TBRC 11911]